MRIREEWRRSKEAIEEERDERSELVAAKAWSRVARVTLPLVFFGLLALIVAPLSGGQREFWLQMLFIATIVVALQTLSVSMRRHRTTNPRLERAVIIRSARWWPFAAVVIGLAELAWKGNLGEAIATAASVLIGTSIGMAILYWRLFKKE